MSKYYRVYADVRLDVICDNVDRLMALTPSGTKALAVVKADGYGHGDVATLDEAVNLRENEIDKPILILGFVNTDEYKTLVKYNVAATVFDYETAKELNRTAKELKKTAICHIKVDTGMRRIGLEPDLEGAAIIKKIVALENIKAEGIFTHFASADEKNKDQANEQFKKFSNFTWARH